MCGWNVSCNELGVVRDCRNSTCESGCFCSNGSVLEDGICVHPDSCPSKEFGIVYIYLLYVLSGRDYVFMILLPNTIGRLLIWQMV